MPRRNDEKGGKGQEPDPEAVEAQRRTDMAFDLGVLSRTRRMCNSTLPPTKQMLRADGKDISKKASTRKGRYLMVFNFQLAPAAAGKLGTLACLDSKNPVLYLDFPQGRYKLFGTLVFPRNKYMVLKLGQKDVLCEDVFESMVVFSEGWWVGTAAENPEERRLPEPDWLAAPKLHDKYDFSGRGAAGSAAGAKEAEPADGEEEEEEPASQRPQRRASRAAGGKRLRYAEDSDGGAAASDESGEEKEEAPPRKLPRLGSQQVRQQRKTQARSQPDSHPKDLSGSDREEGGEHAARGAAKQGTLDAFVKRSASQPPAGAASHATTGKAKTKSQGPARGAANSAKRKVAVSDDEEYVDLASSDDEQPADSDDEEPPSIARPRSQRKAAGAAAQKLRMDSDSDSDEVASQERQESSGASGDSEDAAASDVDGGSESDDGGSDYAPSD